MRYHIDTIPVIDAIKENSECLFCMLQKKLDNKYTDYYLGDSIMQSHIRIRINETGFCSEHYMKMLESDRKLSLALTSTTHLNKILESIKSPLDELTKSQFDIKKGKKAIESLTNEIEDINNKCVICEDIKRDINRYIYTYIYMYKKDSAFIDEIKKSKGFCLHHFAELLKASDKQLHGIKKSEFISLLSKIEKENLERLYEEVKWFCDKFDYKNTDKPWKNSRDSLPRILLKLSGKVVN